LSQITRLTDGQTERQTEFSSLYRICIRCSAVQIISILVSVSFCGDHVLFIQNLDSFCFSMSLLAYSVQSFQY